MIEIVTTKTKNKFGKQVLRRSVKCNEIFNKLSEDGQITWVLISNCMLNLNMTLDQIKQQFIEKEIYSNDIEKIINKVYNLYLKDVISQYQVKKTAKNDAIKIRVTTEEKRTFEIESKKLNLSISDMIRNKIIK
jgi:hypothetical protein